MSLVKNLRKRTPSTITKIAAAIDASSTEDPGYKQKLSFSPSGLGYSGVCPTRWFWAFNGADFQNTFSRESEEWMNHGNDREERIIAQFERAGYVKETQVEVDTTELEGGPPIRGFIDVILDVDGEEIVGEIKSTSSVSWMHRQAKNSALNYHTIQILLYLWATGKEKGLIIYENRDTLEKLLIPISRSKYEEELDYLLDWMREVYQAYKDDLMPIRPAKNENSVVCRSCPLNKYCWSNEREGDVKIKKLDLIRFS